MFGSPGATALKPDHSYLHHGKSVCLTVEKTSLSLEKVWAPLGPGAPSVRKFAPRYCLIWDKTRPFPTKMRREWVSLLWLWSGIHVGSGGNPECEPSTYFQKNTSSPSPHLKWGVGTRQGKEPFWNSPLGIPDKPKDSHLLHS